MTGQTSIVAQLYEVFAKDPQFYRDALRLQGILFKYNEKQGLTVRNMPCCLTPYVISQSDLNKLRSIQLIYQAYLFNVTRDKAFLKSIFKETIHQDAFIQRLFNIYDESLEDKDPQQLELVIVRNDYLLNRDSKVFEMVQFNTISVGLGPHTERLQKFIHRLYNCPMFKPTAVRMENQGWQLKDNNDFLHSLQLVKVAFQMYGNPKAVVVIANEKNERNVFDQRGTGEYFMGMGINYILVPLVEIQDTLRLQVDRRLYVMDKQVAIVYLRSGFRFSDYTQDLWQVRRKMELSKAIMIPSISMQLINMKRAQVELDKPETLKKYLKKEDIELISSFKTSVCDFDNEENYNWATGITSFDDYVLKPNKEGGGNNIYGGEILEVLKNIGPKEAKAYVLMKIIPADVRESVVFDSKSPRLVDTVTEFSQFGSTLTRGDQIIDNRVGGVLVRTKFSTSLEGGISAGQGFLDTCAIKYPK